MSAAKKPGKPGDITSDVRLPLFLLHLEPEDTQSRPTPSPFSRCLPFIFLRLLRPTSSQPLAYFTRCVYVQWRFIMLRLLCLYKHTLRL